MNITGGSDRTDQADWTDQKLRVRWLAVPIRGAAVLITHLRPNGRQPEMTFFEDEICTSAAADLLGLSKRRVQALCDEGTLRQGADWRKKPAAGPNGSYLIKLTAVLRLRDAGAR